MEVDDDMRAVREAALIPTIAKSFYAKYDGSPLPPSNIAQNVLAALGVPQDRTSGVFQLLMENAEYVGLIKTIKDKKYIDLGTPVPQTSTSVLWRDNSGDGELIDPDQTDLETPGTSSHNADERSSAKLPRGNAIFIGHGANHRPMEQLKQILSEYRIPYRQAMAEANRARPIPTKVAEVMQECGAAILVFTADREYFDKDGTSVWLSSENVSHELGAASVLYGDRIVIFKEKGINLPSNFSSIGYIEFERDKLGDKGIELFRELVSMKILSISVGGA
jgi:predicted nucleotide-binding protein